MEVDYWDCMSSSIQLRKEQMIPAAAAALQAFSSGCGCLVRGARASASFRLGQWVREETRAETWSVPARELSVTLVAWHKPRRAAAPADHSLTCESS